MTRKRTKRDPLRTEAAIKKAVKMWPSGDVSIENSGSILTAPYDLAPTEIAFVKDGHPDEVIAIADLRDLYRKRSSIRMKDLRRAIQPKRKGKR